MTMKQAFTRREFPALGAAGPLWLGRSTIVPYSGGNNVSSAFLSNTEAVLVSVSLVAAQAAGVRVQLGSNNAVVVNSANGALLPAPSALVIGLAPGTANYLAVTSADGNSGTITLTELQSEAGNAVAGAIT